MISEICNAANTKGLLMRVFTAMDKLASKEIDASEAMATAKLASQASNVLNYELKRSVIQMKLSQLGAGVEIEEAQIREIEEL